MFQVYLKVCCFYGTCINILAKDIACCIVYTITFMQREDCHVLGFSMESTACAHLSCFQGCIYSGVAAIYVLARRFSS